VSASFLIVYTNSNVLREKAFRQMLTSSVKKEACPYRQEVRYVY
jgi:hypothetical protein